jgi:hypothetical protein
VLLLIAQPCLGTASSNTMQQLTCIDCTSASKVSGAEIAVGCALLPMPPLLLIPSLLLPPPLLLPGPPPLLSLLLVPSWPACCPSDDTPVQDDLLKGR